MPDSGQLEARSSEVLSQVPLVIDSPERESQAVNLLEDMVALRKEIEGGMADPIQKAKAALDSVKALLAKLLKPLEVAEPILRSRLLEYRMKQEQERSMRLLDEEADREYRELIGDTEPVEYFPSLDSDVDSRIGTRTLYEAQVTDLKVLVQAWLEGKAPWDAIQPNLVALNRIARAGKKTVNIPGVAVKEKPTLARRGSR